MGIDRQSFCYRAIYFFDMNVSNTNSKNLVLASLLKQNMNKIRNCLEEPELIMVPLTYAYMLIQNQKLLGGAGTDYGAPNLCSP